MNHAAAIEVIWLIAAIIAFVTVIVALFDAISALAWVDSESGDRRQRMVAELHVRQELFRLVKSGTMIIAASAALFLPPPPPLYMAIPQSLIGMMAFIVISSVIVLESVVDRRTRRQLRDLYNAGLRRRAEPEKTQGSSVLPPEPPTG